MGPNPNLTGVLIRRANLDTQAEIRHTHIKRENDLRTQ